MRNTSFHYHTINLANTGRDVGDNRVLSWHVAGIWVSCLLAFSPVANGSKILSTEQGTKNSLTCLHGLRVMSLGWVVLVHTYLQVFSIAGTTLDSLLNYLTVLCFLHMSTNELYSFL